MNMLRRLRLNAGLTVEALSDLTGVPASTIYNLERGDTVSPRLSTVKPLADELGVPAGDLVAGLSTEKDAA